MAEALAKQLRQLVERGKPSKEAEQLLVQCKCALADLPSLPPNDSITATSRAERTLARDVYESAVALSVINQDMKNLERHLLLLRAFNFDYKQELGDSPRREEMIGLELLALLVDSRVAEFHSLLEMVSMKERDNPFIAFVVAVEQYLMEGSYDKVLDGRKRTPSKLYSSLLENLEETVRDEIATCIEVAYPELSIGAAQKLMNFPSTEAAKEYVASKETWVLEGSKIRFKGEEEKDLADQIPSHKLIKENLGYAHELERII